MDLSSDQLRQYLGEYERIKDELNASIDKATTANTALVIAKAEVQKNKYSLDLIKEKIMTEKKLIDAGK